MNKKIEDLAIHYEPKDTIQPFRVVNLARLVPMAKNEPEILYFCRSHEEATNFIKKHRGEK